MIAYASCDGFKMRLPQMSLRNQERDAFDRSLRVKSSTQYVIASTFDLFFVIPSSFGSFPLPLPF